MENENARLEMMVDIETLGLKPGSVVASIGAIIFDHQGFHADRFFARLNLDSQLEAGLTVSGSTIKWWMKQSDAAKVNTFVGDDEPVAGALLRFADFIRYNQPNTIWAKGPQFDITLLECLFDAYGLKAPWSYRAISDLRTLLKTADVPLDGSVPAKIAAEGEDAEVQHTCMSDCSYQIRELLNARAIIDGTL